MRHEISSSENLMIQETSDLLKMLTIERKNQMSIKFHLLRI